MSTIHNLHRLSPHHILNTTESLGLIYMANNIDTTSRNPFHLWIVNLITSYLAIAYISLGYWRDIGALLEIGVHFHQSRVILDKLFE